MASTTRTFAVKGMTCEGCQAAVTRVLRKVEGVSQAMVDLKGHQATVTFDAVKAGPERLAAAVRKAGYELVVE